MDGCYSKKNLISLYEHKKKSKSESAKVKKKKRWRISEKLYVMFFFTERPNTAYKTFKVSSKDSKEYGIHLMFTELELSEWTDIDSLILKDKA